MTNDERDNMLTKISADQSEMSGDLKVALGHIKSHGETLYGKEGLVHDVTLLQERQEQCPARKANSTERKRLSIAYVMTIIAVISLLTSIAFGIWK